MSPVIINRRGESEWCPKRTSSEINLGHVDEEKRVKHTIKSTARILSWLNEGCLSEQSFVDGLTKNAEHLGIPVELLLDLAHMELEEQKNNPKTDD